MGEGQTNLEQMSASAFASLLWWQAGLYQGKDWRACWKLQQILGSVKQTCLTGADSLQPSVKKIQNSLIVNILIWFNNILNIGIIFKIIYSHNLFTNKIARPSLWENKENYEKQKKKLMSLHGISTERGKAVCDWFYVA